MVRIKKLHNILINPEHRSSIGSAATKMNNKYQGVNALNKEEKAAWGQYTSSKKEQKEKLSKLKFGTHQQEAARQREARPFNFSGPNKGEPKQPTKIGNMADNVLLKAENGTLGKPIGPQPVPSAPSKPASSSSVSGGSNPVSQAAATNELSDRAKVAQKAALRGKSLGGGGGVMSRAGQMGTAGWANIGNAAAREGFSSAGSMAARFAVTGALTGAGIGGTMEAAQGGSFWAGAKEGAFNGAIGFGGARMMKRAVGADSYLGVAKNAGAMWGVTGRGENVASSAKTLMNSRAWEGLSKSVTKAGGKQSV